MDKKVINSIRSLSIDMIDQAGSGHPGICLGAAPIIYTLYAYHLNYNVNDGNWINRDRFILSAGHGSALLYSTLFMAGYPYSLEDLKNFRKLESVTSGHPELNPKMGIEMTTGPLGQGIATSVGFAIAEEYLSHNVSREIFNHFTYVLVGDGDLMEGISYEACSLAGSLKLGKLIVLYDSNNISLDGSTKGVFDEDILKRFEACGWHTENVANAEDINSINIAINNAKAITDKPSIIKVNSIIGYGSKLEGTNTVHGKPLTSEDISLIKEKMGVSQVPFYVSKEAALYFREKVESRTKPIYDAWKNKYNALISEQGAIKKIVDSLNRNEYKLNLKKVKINLEPGFKEELRETNGKLMNLLSELLPLYVAGSADVASSCKTYLKNGKDFKKNGEYGKNISFGVRENVMSSVMNGLAINGFRPVCSAFLTFSDYMKPGIRLSCLMKLPVTYIFTHDSISIGQDGPTHQPIEQLGMLRSIPNMMVFRPCDINELVGSWDYIINHKNPSTIVVSKDKFPMLENTQIDYVEKGAYIIKEEMIRLSGILVASGSDVHTALEVSDELYKKGIFVRVVSMPSMELFDKQDNEYKSSILPAGSKVIIIEASNDSKWKEFVYNNKYLLNVDTFGTSAPSNDVLKAMNFDVESLAKRVEKLLK